MVVRLALALLLVVVAAAGAAADEAATWPERPVKVIVPAPAGGGSDAVARVLAQRLGEMLPQRFIVENRPGVMIAANAVAKAEPDGYLLLMASPLEVALAPHLYRTMSYDPATDLAPVSLVAWTPLVIAAHPSFPASTPAEFLAAIARAPTDYAHPGVGSAHHLTAEYVNRLARGKLVPVPYRGAAPALTDTVSGQVKLTVSGLPPALPFLQSGDLKGIAVTSRRRSALLPDLPALAETAGFEDLDASNWFGLVAPRGTPPAVVARLNRAVVEALGDERVRAVLSAQAAEPVGNSPAAFAAFIRQEAAKYGRMAALIGLVPN